MKEQIMASINEQLLSTLENSKNYTMSVAEAMPDKGYSFRPTEGVMDFGELLSHIAYGIQWWEANYVKGEKTDWAPPAAKATKAEVIAYLQKAYKGLEKTLSGSLNEDAVRGFYATTDHITHHRGQAVTYLRCKGITPPDYQY
jgi:uncharacterized damage-inducible protein DinB